MFPSLPTALLLIPLLASVPSPSRADERHIELTAEPSGQEPEVRISPHQASSLVFNAPLKRGSVVVQEREFFHSVMVDEKAGLVTLMPSAVLPPGTALMLAVRFADEDVPESATFRLVIHPDGVDRQVRVDRRPRSGASYQEEARRMRERAEQCEVEWGRQTARKGLVELLNADLVRKGIGIQSQDIRSHLIPSSEGGLHVNEAYSYRAIGRVAVDLWVKESGQRPWWVNEAQLLDAEGRSLRVLRTWQSPGPLLPGDLRQIVVEAEAPEPQSRGSFLLRLTESEGARTLTVRGVTFP
jgi:uncharacterized protein (TIGR02268 family)